MEEYEIRRESVEKKKKWIEENLNRMSPMEIIFRAGLSLRRVTSESKTTNPNDEAIDWAIAFAEFCEEHPETWPLTMDEVPLSRKEQNPPGLPLIKPSKKKAENWLSFFRKFLP